MTQDLLLRRQYPPTPVYDAVKDDVLAQYPCPEYYHSARHAEEVAMGLRRHFPDLPPGSLHEYPNQANALDICMVAALFHDIVYKAGAHPNENENESASLADGWLGSAGLFTNMERLLVRALIQFTASQEDNTLATPSRLLLRDMDWLHFTDLDKLAASDPLLWNEARRDGIPAHKWLCGRIDFLERLNGTRVFNSFPCAGFNYLAHANASARAEELKARCGDVLSAGHPGARPAWTSPVYGQKTTWHDGNEVDFLPKEAFEDINARPWDFV